MPAERIPFLTPSWFEMVNSEAATMPEIPGATVVLVKGRVQMTGDLEAGFRLAPVTDSAAYRELNRRIHARTDFG